MPFTLQPAVGENFIDREEIVREMIATLTNKNIVMGFALVGNRRMGKSSILREVYSILGKDKRIVPVYFSLWSLLERTVEEFSRSLTFSVLEAYKKRLSLKYRLKDLIKVPAQELFDFLRRIDVRIKILENLEISLSEKGSGKDIPHLLNETLLLPEKLADDTGAKCVILLDEFPSIMELSLQNGRMVGDTIIRKIRTIQESYRRTTICISGSIKKTMEMTVLSSSSPFYRQFTVKNILPFERDNVRLLLEKNLGVKLSREAIDTALNLTNGIPFYLQFIGRGLIRYKKKNINPKKMKEVFQELLKEEGNLLFSEEFNSLGSRERRVLFEMAKNSLARLNEIARASGESLNVLGRYLEYLMKKGVIVRESRGSYRFVDPVFETWIKQSVWP